MSERAPGKRVRTGCWTCRGRRRKCDEQRPQCANCLSKGLTCRYGSRLTFVASKFQTESQARTTPARQQVEIDHSSSGWTPTPTATEVPQTAQLGFSHSFGHFEANPSTANASPIEAPTSGPLPTSTQQQQRHAPTPDALHGTRDLRRKTYDLGLLTYYRYHVAPILDLGLGRLHFGVSLLIESKLSEPISLAILALASSQRAIISPSTEQVDQATSITSAHLARDDAALQYEILTTTQLLLLWRTVYLAPINQWPGFVHHVQQCARCPIGVLEEWLVVARLHCAVWLTRTDGASDTAPILSDPPLSGNDEHPAILELKHSLWLLAKVLGFIPSDPRLSRVASLPPGQEWLAQWHELQEWSYCRTREMRPICEISDGKSLYSSQDTVEFPYIIFSSACATVANVAHHMASFWLLQHKPRLTKPDANVGSSISSIWHAHRVIGIISAAASAEIWDPFMTAALLHCSDKLSDSRQIRSVANVMRQIQNISGLQLAIATSELDERARANE